MKAAPFQRQAPQSVDEAVDLLASDDDAVLLAGGQSMVPIMRFRLATPGTVIDLNGVSGLDHLTEADGHLRIGALVRHGDVEDSDLIADRYGAFADTAPVVAERRAEDGDVGGSAVEEIEESETAVDPVCGMAVPVDDPAATVEHDGETYYFCCRGCADTFAAHPEEHVETA